MSDLVTVYSPEGQAVQVPPDVAQMLIEQKGYKPHRGDPRQSIVLIDGAVDQLKIQLAAYMAEIRDDGALPAAKVREHQVQQLVQFIADGWGYACQQLAVYPRLPEPEEPSIPDSEPEEPQPASLPDPAPEEPQP